MSTSVNIQDVKLDSGHEVVPLEKEELEQLKKDFPAYGQMIRLSPGRWMLPVNYLKFANKIYNFELRSRDVMLMTYPKCGTTWAQEILWTMLNNPNLDHPLTNKSAFTRAPYLDFDMLAPKSHLDPNTAKDPVFHDFLRLCPGKNPEDGFNLQLADALPDPRTLKTHLPFSLTPPAMLDTCKVVFVARNPKDVIVSFLNHCRMDDVINFVGTFENFVNHFVNDNLLYGPYWRYLKEAWERKDHPNLHIVFFEDVKTNPKEELTKLDSFLNTKLTEKQMDNIVKHTSFPEMKAREEKLMKETYGDITIQFSEQIQKNMAPFEKEQHGFFRKGKIGDWKEKFTPELDAKVNEWIQKNISNVGVNFRYLPS